MKQWIKANAKRVILSSIVTLLPVLYGVLRWDQLPNSFTTHWGSDGIADGTGSKVFVVFGIPAIFLVVNLLCLICTYFDKYNRDKNQKAMGLVLWIMPILSVFINCIIYKSTDGSEMDLFWLFPVMFGVLFIAMGNYLPKIEKNKTLGIKISWTLGNEENWNKTHRLCGKLWVIGGAIILATSLLPLKWSIYILLAIIFVMIIVPYIYSYRIYCKHKQQGIEYVTPQKTKNEKAAIKFSAVFTPLILVGVLLLMITGNIEYEFTEDSLKIDATFGNYSVVGYEFIDAVEYREDFDFGIRNMGFASAKLSIGNFRNDEFGNYTLYAYNKSGSAVVIKSGEHIMVITGEDSAATQTLYQTLQDNIK